MALLLAVGGIATGAIWLQREAPNHRAEVVRWLDESLGVAVTLEQLSLHWAWQGPEVVLGGITVRAIDQQTPIPLHEVRVGFSFLDLVHGRAAVPSRVEVRQADLQLERRLDGQWLIQGIPLGGQGQDAGPAWKTAIPVLERLGEITLRDATVSLTMTGREIPVQRFTGVDVRLASAGERHRVEVTSRSAAMLGENFSLALDAHGPLAEPQNWVVQLQATLAQASPSDYLEPWVGRWLDLRRSRVSLDFDGRWDPHGDSQFRLVTDVRGLVLPAVDRHAESHLNRLSGQFTWKGQAADWTLAIKDLRVAIDSTSWPTSQGRLHFRRASATQAGEWAGSLTALRLQDVQRLWIALPTSWRHELASGQMLAWEANQLHGDIRDLMFSMEQGSDETPGSLDVAAKFQDLGWSPEGAIPGMSGLNGAVQATERGGWLTAGGEAVSFQDPELFEQPWPAGALESELRWERKGENWEFTAPQIGIRHSDLKAQGSLAMVWRPGQRPLMDLQVAFQDVNAAVIDRYLPRRHLPPDTARWLRASIRDGHIREGQLVLRGDLARFPFRDGGGEFKVTAALEGGVLRFHPDWPELEAIDGRLTFTGTGFRVDARSVRSGGLTLAETHVEMADYRDLVLVAEGQGRGEHQGALDYLAHAPPGQAVRVLLDGARGSGPVRLDLHLTLPLRDMRQARVAGAFYWDGARLEQPDWGVALDEIRGSLQFHEDHLEATDIQAQLDGVPVQLQVSALPDAVRAGGFRATQVRLQGGLPAALLRRQLAFLDPHTIQGKTDLDAHFDVLPEGRLRWSAQSTLQGLALNWPAPLGKPAELQRPLVLRGNGDGSGHRIEVEQGELIRGSLFLLPRETGWIFDRGLIGFNQSADTLPDLPGLWIQGRLERLTPQDLAAWHSIWAVRGTPSGQPWTLPPWLGGIDLAVGVVEGPGLRQAGVQFALERSGAFPSLHLQAPALEGNVRMGANGNFWQVNLKHLDLDALQQATDSGNSATDSLPRSTLDPRTVPPVRLAAERVRYRGNDLGRMELQLQPTSEGVAMNGWTLEGPAVHLSGSGHWNRAGQDTQSDLAFHMETGDLPTLARRLGHPDAMDARRAAFTGRLNWPGAPWEVASERARGDFQLEADEGAIYLRETRPTTGVVMGLAGLYDLPRRLTHDFSGVFRPSLPFSRIRGDLHLERGVVETRMLHLEGPAADVRMTGTSDLRKRQFDQELVVTPGLSAGLALAATVAGGPIAGAAVFLGGKLWRQPMGRLVQIRYRLEGGFDAATLEREQGPFNLPETPRP
ncbi:MAG: YhdP family protein [Pseudomonadota bacterium]